MDSDLDMLDGDRITAAARYLRDVHGITFLPIVAIVYGMASAPGERYHKILWYWSVYDYKIAGYPKAGPWWWHNEMCRQLLKAGADTSEGTEHWFEARAKEVRDLAY